MSFRLGNAFGLVLSFTLAGTAADDRFGDPIPNGAKARLGTVRLRQSNGVSLSVMTPDGKFLVGDSPIGGISYIDPATGSVVRTVKTEGEFGSPAEFSADGRRAVSSSVNGAVVWDTETGKALAKVVHAAPGGDHGVSLSSDGKRLAIGGMKDEKEKQPSAIVWDVDANKRLASILPVQNETVRVALSPDGKRLATWGDHSAPKVKERQKPDADPLRQVQFWDVSTGQQTAKVFVPSEFRPDNIVVFSPDGTVAAVSTGNSTIHLFDPATGDEKGPLLGCSWQGHKLAFSPNGQTLASTDLTGTIQRWGLPEGKRLGITESPVPVSNITRAILFTDNDRVVAWGTRRDAAVMWEAPSGKLISLVGGHVDGIHSIAIAGSEVLTAGHDRAILRWNPMTGEELGSIPLRQPGDAKGGLATHPPTLSPNGKWAIVPDAGSGLSFYDLKTGEQQFVIPGDSGRDIETEFTADSLKAVQVIGSYNLKESPARVIVWDVALAKRLGQVELPGIGYPAAALTPDGKILVTAGQATDDKGDNSTFHVIGWDLSTGKRLAEFRDTCGLGHVYIAAAGDNKSVVVTTPKGPLVVIDATTGKKLRDLELGGEGFPNRSPVVGPDGKTVAVLLRTEFDADARRAVVLVDIETGKLKRALTGMSGNVSAAAFSPDGRWLVTGSLDTTALVWDLAK